MDPCVETPVVERCGWTLVSPIGKISFGDDSVVSGSEQQEEQVVPAGLLVDVQEPVHGLIVNVTSFAVQTISTVFLLLLPYLSIRCVTVIQRTSHTMCSRINGHLQDYIWEGSKEPCDVLSIACLEWLAKYRVRIRKLSPCLDAKPYLMFPFIRHCGEHLLYLHLNFSDDWHSFLSTLWRYCPNLIEISIRSKVYLRRYKKKGKIFLSNRLYCEEERYSYKGSFIELMHLQGYVQGEFSVDDLKRSPLIVHHSIFCFAPRLRGDKWERNEAFASLNAPISLTLKWNRLVKTELFRYRVKSGRWRDVERSLLNERHLILLNGHTWYGDTLLGDAIECGQTSVALLMLSDPDVDVNIQHARLGNTPLHYACRFLDFKVIYALIGRGVDETMCNLLGCTAWEVIQEMLTALERHHIKDEFAQLTAFVGDIMQTQPVSDRTMMCYENCPLSVYHELDLMRVLKRTFPYIYRAGFHY